MSRFRFELQAEALDSRARAGTLITAHGRVDTPVFMPVGTLATVRSQTIDSLKSVGSQVLLANTYHLMLQPGAEVFQKFGGIHRFMRWDRPVLTDSGGFQVFSLSKNCSMTEEGATFQDHSDGRKHFLSPEISIQMQKSIGSDIMMVLDECIASTAEHAQARSAMERTHRWARRSLSARTDSPQALFGIVQGACFTDLRRESAETLSELPFEGMAIGGLAVGESTAEREDVTELTTALLPREKPRYLMGVGTPIDILEGVHRGVDMFDCILPVAWAQRGAAFTSEGKLQLRRTAYRLSEDRLDPVCDCATCSVYSRAYLHHLHKADEVLGWTLIAQHNLRYYHRLMNQIRESILCNRYHSFYRRLRNSLRSPDHLLSS